MDWKTSDLGQKHQQEDEKGTGPMFAWGKCMGSDADASWTWDLG